MVVLCLDFSKERKIITDREVDKMICEKVLGWVRWNNDWYTQIENGYKFQQLYLWSPTTDGSASQLVWLKCLEKARELGYELSQEMDAEGRIHMHGFHPVAPRLLVIDKEINHAICRFAFKLFGLERP